MSGTQGGHAWCGQPGSVSSTLARMQTCRSSTCEPGTGHSTLRCRLWGRDHTQAHAWKGLHGSRPIAASALLRCAGPVHMNCRPVLTAALPHHLLLLLRLLQMRQHEPGPWHLWLHHGRLHRQDCLPGSAGCALLPGLVPAHLWQPQGRALPHPLRHRPGGLRGTAGSVQRARGCGGEIEAVQGRSSLQALLRMLLVHECMTSAAGLRDAQQRLPCGLCQAVRAKHGA